jgi:glutaconate CoA-transferase subunit A
VVHQPYGAHPSYAQGYYHRDNRFYLEWDLISRDEATVNAWLDGWVHGVDDWTGYLSRLEAKDPDIWERLAPGRALSQPVNYGLYGQGETRWTTPLPN